LPGTSGPARSSFAGPQSSRIDCPQKNSLKTEIFLLRPRVDYRLFNIWYSKKNRNAPWSRIYILVWKQNPTFSTSRDKSIFFSWHMLYMKLPSFVRHCLPFYFLAFSFVFPPFSFSLFFKLLFRMTLAEITFPPGRPSCWPTDRCSCPS
jgi:hypothetical protein